MVVLEVHHRLPGNVEAAENGVVHPIHEPGSDFIWITDQEPAMKHAFREVIPKPEAVVGLAILAGGVFDDVDAPTGVHSVVPLEPVWALCWGGVLSCVPCRDVGGGQGEEELFRVNEEGSSVLGLEEKAVPAWQSWEPASGELGEGVVAVSTGVTTVEKVLESF